MTLDSKDIEFLDKKGISEEQLREQLEMIRIGFPYLRLEAAATPGHGISEINAEMALGALSCWETVLQQGGKVIKMVPASGAASRMFKDIFAFINGKTEKPDTDFIRLFFDKIEKFAFFPSLNSACVSLYGKSVATLMDEKKYKDVARALIESDGLDYGRLPKALLEFHKVQGRSRTALEEHLAEGAQYAAGRDRKVHVHFTLSDSHLPLARIKVEETSGHLGHYYNADYDITYSVQKPSTDTIAANLDGTPCREDGHLFFRPGGHGALIENLNDLDADVIFIKNIDNVVGDDRRESTIHYKKVLGGTLVAVKQRIDQYCRLLRAGVPDENKLDEMLHFLRSVLCITHDGADDMDTAGKAAYIFSKLNRPLRVCGMVRNSGEPGGGPFLVHNQDGTVSPQILESTQINHANPDDEKIFRGATHFNPVDLAVATRDFEGHKFNLPDFVDMSTCFISEKSRDGVEIKALELPGLWNGAMSDWNTIFIEVAAETFNPVKTVNDLLRPAHQPL